jgi:hypothetical protein
VSLQASTEADEQRFTSGRDSANEHMLIGRDCSQHVVKVGHRVAICDDLASVSDGHPTIAELFEERRVHDVKGTNGVRDDSFDRGPFGSPIEHLRDPLPD